MGTFVEAGSSWSYGPNGRDLFCLGGISRSESRRHTAPDSTRGTEEPDKRCSCRGHLKPSIQTVAVRSRMKTDIRHVLPSVVQIRTTPKWNERTSTLRRLSGVALVDPAKGSDHEVNLHFSKSGPGQERQYIQEPQRAVEKKRSRINIKGRFSSAGF